MKLSDAIEAGTLGLMTAGPSWDTDVYYAAFRGLHGRNPTTGEMCEFYHRPPWGYPSDTEYALRVMTVFGCKWSEVIKRLREKGL